MFARTFSTAIAKDISKLSTCSYRLATAKDIPSIRLCNLQSLPENYSDSWYENHLRKFPGLSLIAENEHQKLIGYALGRIEEPEAPLYIHSSVVKDIDQPAMAGHVASIAVSHNSRGKGVAKVLMKKLHSQFLAEYKVKSVSLHCRISNTAAINLYFNTFKYRCVDELKRYYEDGETAWLMRLENLDMSEELEDI